MPDIYFKSVPFSKEDVTLALESGVDGIITEAEHVEGVRSLALCDVRAEADMPSVGLGSKAEEESIASRIAGGERLVLAQGWEIIPVENLLAQPAVAGKLAVEVRGCWWATPAPSPSLRTPKRSTTNMWRRGLSASTRAACTPMR